MILEKCMKLATINVLSQAYLDKPVGDFLILQLIKLYLIFSIIKVVRF